MKKMAAEKVLMSGQYLSLSEMAADINEEGGGGQWRGWSPQRRLRTPYLKICLK